MIRVAKKIACAALLLVSMITRSCALITPEKSAVMMTRGEEELLYSTIYGKIYRHAIDTYGFAEVNDKMFVVTNGLIVGGLYDFNADGIKEMLLVTGELEHDNDWGLLATKLNISITTIKDGQPINVIDDDEFVLVGAGVGQLGLSKIKGGGYALHSVWGHGHGAEEKYLFINKKGNVIISGNNEQIEYDGWEWYLYDSSAFTFVDNTEMLTGRDYLSFLETQLTIWARPSSETIILNSEHKDIITYKIGDNNFLKLRDIAYLLSGTKAEFNVSWDSILKRIMLVSGQKYISTGDELTNTSLATKKAQETSVKIDLNKKSVSLDAYEIDGNIFVKLRDIGNLLGFSVEWNSLNSVIEINT